KGDGSLAAQVFNQQTRERLTTDKRGIAIAYQHSLWKRNQGVNNFFSHKYRVTRAQLFLLERVVTTLTKNALDLLSLISNHHNRSMTGGNSEPGRECSSGGKGLDSTEDRRQERQPR